MSNVYISIISFFGILMCSPVMQAQPLSESEPVSVNIDTLELHRIVVTASKIPLTQRETTKPVLIIDRKEIERSGSRNIGQLLNQQSGIRVNDSYGSPANPQTLYLQGASAQYTLILIDGLAINDPSGTGGTFDLRSLPLNNVEQIEVLKGSQSTLYGSDAIAGVVNIITKEGDPGPLNGTGQLAYGSYNTFLGSAGVNGTLNKSVRYTLNYKRESSDGISAAAVPENAGTFGDDGFTSDAFYGKADLNPVESLTLSPFLNYNDFKGDYDADAFQDADNEFSLTMFNPGIQLSYNSGDFSLNGGYNYTRTERTFVSEFGENEFEGRFNNADLYGTYVLPYNLQLLGGLNYQQSNLPETEDTEGFDSQITSPYATLFLKDLNGLSAELGYRLNSHSEYGSNSTYSFAPSFNVTGNLKVFGSVTTAFKAPTLSDLFGPFGANPDLDPQTSRYISVGAETYLMDQTLKLSAQYFDREIEDLIVYVSGQGFVNRDQQKDSGIELSGDWIVSDDLRFGAYYNYLEGEIITFDSEGNEVSEDNLIRRPSNSFGAHAGVSVTEHLLVRIDGEYNGERSDIFFNPETFEPEDVSLDSYTLVNVYAEYSFMEGQLTIFTDIRNLFDTDFTEVYGYNNAGLTLKGGIRFNL